MNVPVSMKSLVLFRVILQFSSSMARAGSIFTLFERKKNNVKNDVNLNKIFFAKYKFWKKPVFVIDDREKKTRKPQWKRFENINIFKIVNKNLF